MTDRVPNWGKWKLIPSVEAWQAVCLSLGIDPEQVYFKYQPTPTLGGQFDESKEFQTRLEVSKLLRLLSP